MNKEEVMKTWEEYDKVIKKWNSLVEVLSKSVVRNLNYYAKFQFATIQKNQFCIYYGGRINDIGPTYQHVVWVPIEMIFDETQTPERIADWLRKEIFNSKKPISTIEE